MTLERKATEEKKKEDERRVREEERVAKIQEKRVEEEAKRAAHLAELEKSLETATLHKNYVKNLHAQAQAQAKETEEYEEGIEKLKRWRDPEEVREGESSKRLASSPAELTPLAKKQVPK